eukprot:5846559-Alexandrium_andersonii.AAC.1
MPKIGRAETTNTRSARWAFNVSSAQRRKVGVHSMVGGVQAPNGGFSVVLVCKGVGFVSRGLVVVGPAPWGIYC